MVLYHKYIMSEKLLIFQKSYDFTLWLLPHIAKMPKNYQINMGRKLQDTCLEILLAEQQANKERSKEKRHVIQQTISVKLDELRIQIRLLTDLKVFSIKQYTYASDKMNEIARMLQSWMNIL